jgi:hypothetical protein
LLRSGLPVLPLSLSPLPPPPLFFVECSHYCLWVRWDFKRSRVIQDVCCGPVLWFEWIGIQEDTCFYMVAVAGWLFIVSAMFLISRTSVGMKSASQCWNCSDQSCV